jgi:hypothetical protein
MWLEVLEGPDAGLRVAVPQYSSTYSKELEQKLAGMSVGEVHRFVLQSESTAPPQWRVKSVTLRSTVKQENTD